MKTKIEKKMGRPINQRIGKLEKKISLLVNNETFEKFKKLALRRKKSVNFLINDFMLKKVSPQKKKNIKSSAMIPKKKEGFFKNILGLRDQTKVDWFS